MDKVAILAISLSLASILLSSVALYWSWTPAPTEPKLFDFSVTVNSAVAYRVYVHVNSQTTVADEETGINTYLFSAGAGQEIEIKVLPETPSASRAFEFAYEAPYQLIQRITRSPYELVYNVPQ